MNVLCFRGNFYLNIGVPALFKTVKLARACLPFYPIEGAYIKKTFMIVVSFSSSISVVCFRRRIRTRGNCCISVTMSFLLWHHALS